MEKKNENSKTSSFGFLQNFLKIGCTFNCEISSGFLISVGSWDMIQNSISFGRMNQTMCAQKFQVSLPFLKASVKMNFTK